MDSEHFDHLTSRVAAAGTRRRALGVLAATFGLGGIGFFGPHDAEAGGGGNKKKKRKKKKKNNNQNPTSPPPPVGPTKALGEICTPSVDTCTAPYQCASPTTRQTCDSTVDEIAFWCCVPPSGACTECNCCGDNCCGDNGMGGLSCIHNPEDD